VILSVAGKSHPQFLRLLWVIADMQTVKSSISLRMEMTSGVSVSSGVELAHSARNVIGLAVADASTIRSHLSVHDTAHPTRLRAPLLFALGRRLID